jgi:Icc-related predicted phosphoesterase
MKILHLSDTHGTLKPLKSDAKIVVHSGDFLPNCSRGLKWMEIPFQAKWIEKSASNIRKVYEGRRLLVLPGNHDFVALGKLLKEEGVNVECLNRRLVHVDGFAFYGFPLVPWFCGEWNFEETERSIEHHLGELKELMETGAVDVLVSHGPLFGVLDQNEDGENCGSTSLMDCLLKARHPPKYVLHGHIHEAAGVKEWNKIAVSNAACIQREMNLLQKEQP